MLSITIIYSQNPTLSFLIVDARRLRFNSRKVLCVAAKKNSESLIRHSYECTKNSITIAKDSVSAISSVCLQLRIYTKIPCESPIPSMSAIRKERVAYLLYLRLDKLPSSGKESAHHIDIIEVDRTISYAVFS